MKISKIVLLLLPLVLISMSLEENVDITGKWAFQDSPREIEIYMENYKYFGKIIKVSGTNDNEKTGHILLKDFVFDQSDKNYSGEVNSPDGMTATGQLMMLDENKLRFSLRKLFISKTFILKRIK